MPSWAQCDVHAHELPGMVPSCRDQVRACARIALGGTNEAMAQHSGDVISQPGSKFTIRAAQSAHCGGHMLSAGCRALDMYSAPTTMILGAMVPFLFLVANTATAAIPDLAREHLELSHLYELLPNAQATAGNAVRLQECQRPPLAATL